MYSFIRNLLFKLDPEVAHHLALKLLSSLPNALLPRVKSADSINAMGLHFAHRIGLAAGLDKNGEYVSGLAKLGFSFIEIGTVTPQPQPGNPSPRLFRIPSHDALINRMGFNNDGVNQLLINLANEAYQGILGINIGKNKNTPLTHATQDYLYCFDKVKHCASYITLNISSPNTPDLRQLQQDDYLKHLITQLKQAQSTYANESNRYVPLVIKVSPDESHDTLKRMGELCVLNGIDGIIATNTTCCRTQIEGAPNADESGGLSGHPLAKRSTDCLRVIKEVVGNQLTLIGVGGIDSPERAKEKIAAGASLLQVYTGLIYQGPRLINRLIGV